jgi:predicted acyl esterase
MATSGTYRDYVNGPESWTVAPFRTPRTYDQDAASPFPTGISPQITFDLLPTSVLFRPGDKIRITIAAADPDNFQLLPAGGNVSYRISSTLADPRSSSCP